MQTPDYIEAVREQGTELAQAAERAGLGAPVPTCPPWLVKDLLRHTGYIHRWAARHISERPKTVIDGPPEAEILRGGAPDAELIAWFRAGYEALVETLASADPALECATLMAAPSGLEFWSRRQAHETAIHRADAVIASGARPAYAPEFAADGIDELIMGFGQRRKYRPSAGAAPGALRVHATDTGDAWYVAADQGRIQARREPGEPGPHDSVVSAPASDVYLFLWNRSGPAPAGVTITGPRDFLTSWQTSVRIRWE